ncbi:acyl-CoA-like ligand-binding transcription factor [Streptomyces sp. JNUCC 63]
MEPPSSSAIASMPVRSGRPPATSRADLERFGFELFARRGFEDTTVNDIARAAGIGRRTFFRYFSSKNDLVWGDFEEHLVRFRELLDAADPSTPVMDALREAVVEFNRFDAAVVPWHRQRMELILTVPTLQADATLRYASWRAIVTEFVARRTGLSPSDDRIPPGGVADQVLGMRRSPPHRRGSGAANGADSRSTARDAGAVSHGVAGVRLTGTRRARSLTPRGGTRPFGRVAPALWVHRACHGDRCV